MGTYSDGMILGKTVRSCHNGTQRLYKFPNGRGASVVRHDFSYGHEKGLWEVAVLGKHGELDYSTPITRDVLGHLTVERVNEVLAAIAALG